MADDRVRVSRRLYLLALDDAIDWTTSVLDTHNNPKGISLVSCCLPEARCEQYLFWRRRLADYERARKGIRRAM